MEYEAASDRPQQLTTFVLRLDRPVLFLFWFGLVWIFAIVFCLFLFPSEDSFCVCVVFRIQGTFQRVYKFLGSKKQSGLLVGSWLLVTVC